MGIKTEVTRKGNASFLRSLRYADQRRWIDNPFEQMLLGRAYLTDFIDGQRVTLPREKKKANSSSARSFARLRLFACNDYHLNARRGRTFSRPDTNFEFGHLNISTIKPRRWIVWYGWTPVNKPHARSPALFRKETSVTIFTPWKYNPSGISIKRHRIKHEN